MSWGKEYSRPLPELLDGDDWEVRNSGDCKKAYVDFKKKEFVVPFMYGPSGELVRAHEAMHVKISPHKHSFKEADFTTYQSVEDTRVNQGLRLAGIPTDRGRVYKEAELQKVFADLKFQTPLRLGEAFFATKGLAEEGDIREIIEALNPDRPEVLEICEDLHSKYFTSNESEGYLTTEEEVNKCVEELKKRMEKISTEPEKARDQANKGTPSDKKGKNLTQAWVPGQTDKTSFEDTMELDLITDEEAREMEDALPRRYKGNYYGENAIPGKMDIEHPKFDSFIKFKKVKGVKKIASDEGVIPSRMYRYATDMRVFSSSGRRRTSSAVLVDVSGSMGLSSGDIAEIVRLSPGGIVAIYSGKRKEGTLRIVAEKNRFYSKVNYGMGGANVVDHPAIQWLAARPEKKKIWICDGQVTGENDSNLDDLYIRKMVKLIQSAKIIRIGDVRSLVKSGILIDGKFDGVKEIGTRHAARVVDSSGKTMKEFESYEAEDF